MKLAISMLFACAAFAQTAAVKPSYVVHRAPAPVTIDGTVDAKEWAAASPAMEFIFPWETQTGAKQKTHARMMWDDEFLYVVYESDDTDITGQVKTHDGFVYRDDTVELFLNVKPTQLAGYYCVEINVLGTIMDYVCIDSQYYIRRLEMEGMKVGIKVDGTLNQRDDQDRGWSLELAIPWKNFSDMARPPVDGTVMTANLNRWDGVDPTRRLSVWADSKLNWPHPHAPANFGELKFVK